MSIRYLKVVLLCSICLQICGSVLAQLPVKVVAECTITYSVNFEEGSSKSHSIKSLFIKGRKSRSEITTATFYQATIFDNKTGEAIVLKELGGDKYISQFSADEWKERNKQWENISLTFTNETKKILNYNCKKAIASVPNGNSFSVYYTVDLAASATENPYQFKGIPGLILEYKSENEDKNNIQFTATDINFSPVPAAKFLISTSGYRVIH